MSVEQTNDFHIVRRIVRMIAPDYRLFASSRVPEHACVLDIRQKTIEVGESNDVFQAISALLFQLGHLRLRNEPRYALFFGDGIREWQDSPEALVEKLARQGSKIDHAAVGWASSIFRSYWPDRPDITDTLMNLYVWNPEQWREYFNSR